MRGKRRRKVCTTFASRRRGGIRGVSQQKKTEQIEPLKVRSSLEAYPDNKEGGIFSDQMYQGGHQIENEPNSSKFHVRDLSNKK